MSFTKASLIPNQPPKGLIAAVGVSPTPSAVADPDGGYP
jgi:hypothetical protein